MKTCNLYTTFTLLLTLVATGLTHAQKTCVVKANIVQDCELNSLNPNQSYPDIEHFRAKAGTSGGNNADVRSMIQFDLSSIDSTMTIDSAHLNLYYRTAPSGQPHDQNSGSNATTLRGVTSAWQDATINWNNPPALTDVNKVEIPATTNDTQDLKNLDVTQLVQDMINHPSSYFGMHLQLDNEADYRKVTFSSSDDPDTNQHPELFIYYTCADSTIGVKDHKLGSAGMKAYCNDQFLTIITDNSVLDKIVVFNLEGRPLFTSIPNELTERIDMSDFASGLYVVHARNAAGEILRQKVVLVK